MNRREIITLLAGAAVLPVAARAQVGPTRRIGALIGSDESDRERQMWIEEFRRTLLRLGWAEGRNIRIDWRWAAADRDRAKTYAAELVSLQPDLIFVDNTFTADALQRATRTLPIVFAHITDPVTSGFVSSLARPGSNITGFSDSEPETRSKLVEFAKQLVPDVMRIATVGGPAKTGIGRNIIAAVATAAASLGLKNTVIEVSNDREIEDAIVGFGREANGAVIVPGDPVTTAHRKLILAVAGRYRLPVIGGYRPLAADGALLSYGANVNEQYQGAASYVDRVLKGEKPAALPVQQPTKYELRVNVRTAKALGLTVPSSMQQLADEVIE
jgi:ABC-type uncharacterized transport system substrate-binding protein